jgi:hypothetical protein
MSTREQLLRDIEDFLERHGMTPSAFGLAAVNDAKLVPNLRKNLDIRTRTMDRARQFMRERDSSPPGKRAA